MPKKKQWGTNPRAEASRERKATAKEEATEKKRRDEEDAYWRDDDKHAAKKEQKKVRFRKSVVVIQWNLCGPRKCVLIREFT